MTQSGRPILIFDGECNFCNASVDYVMRHEKDETLLFCWMSSNEAKRLLKSNTHLLDNDNLILIKGDTILEASDAALAVCQYLKPPHAWWAYLRIIPKGIRNPVYRVIARYRKKIMGSTSCVLPIGKEHRFTA